MSIKEDCIHFLEQHFARVDNMEKDWKFSHWQTNKLQLNWLHEFVRDQYELGVVKGYQAAQKDFKNGLWGKDDA